eukprot:g35401.t1
MPSVTLQPDLSVDSVHLTSAWTGPQASAWTQTPHRPQCGLDPPQASAWIQTPGLSVNPDPKPWCGPRPQASEWTQTPGLSVVPDPNPEISEDPDPRPQCGPRAPPTSARTQTPGLSEDPEPPTSAKTQTPGFSVDPDPRRQRGPRRLALRFFMVLKELCLTISIMVVKTMVYDFAIHASSGIPSPREATARGPNYS